MVGTGRVLRHIGRKSVKLCAVVRKQLKASHLTCMVRGVVEGDEKVLLQYMRNQKMI